MDLNDRVGSCNARHNQRIIARRQKDEDLNGISNKRCIRTIRIYLHIACSLASSHIVSEQAVQQEYPHYTRTNDAVQLFEHS